MRKRERCLLPHLDATAVVLSGSLVRLYFCEFPSLLIPTVVFVPGDASAQHPRAAVAFPQSSNGRTLARRPSAFFYCLLPCDTLLRNNSTVCLLSSSFLKHLHYGW